MNDGTVDPQGRFLVGTVSLGEHVNQQLLRISPDGSVEVLRTGITLSNGLAFTADGTLLHVDTFEEYRKRYDPNDRLLNSYFRDLFQGT